MKKIGISEKILFGAFHILLDWERSNVNLDENLDRMRREDTEGGSAIASLLFEYFRHKDFVDSLLLKRARKGGIKLELRALLACAVTQTVFQTGIAAQSAANIAVECAKKKFGKGPGAFVNAVLHSILSSDEVKTPPQKSFPETLHTHWNTVLGEKNTDEIMKYYAVNPPPVFRARTSIPEQPEIYQKIDSLDFTAPCQFYEILNMEKFLALGWLEQGKVYIQDPATMLPLSLLEAPPEGTILDACAAPGGKSILLYDLAHLAGKKIQMTAADRSAQRLQILEQNLKQAGVQAKTLHLSAQENIFPEHSFSLILADVPCGNSGVIRRRCDAPWRFSRKKLADVVSLQREILTALCRLAAPGGCLLYSTCSIEPDEDEIQIQSFLTQHPDFKLIHQRKLFPGPYNDGAFGALLKRRFDYEK